MTQNLIRIIIEGETASDVQGTELRESIQKISTNLEINGQIRNVKGQPKVEIICEKEKSEILYEQLNKLKERKDTLFKIKNITKTDELFDNLDSFKVVREDDLSEMVWALQGAGNAFKFLGDMLLKKDIERKKSLLTSLKYELASISAHLGFLQSKERNSEFHLFSIENFLKEPPLEEDDLLTNLRDLYDICQETNYLLKNGKDVENNLKRISELIKITSERVDQFKDL